MRQYTSVEILAWEENALAVNTAIDVLKSHLEAIPDLPAVWRDVQARCKDEVHLGLIDWIDQHMPPGHAQGGLPKAYSPKRNLSTWMLYQAADLECPDEPPIRRK